MTKRWLMPACLVALLGGGPTLAATAGHDQHAAPAAPATTADKTIAASGTVKSVDAAAGKLTIDHDPIPARHWPRWSAC